MKIVALERLTLGEDMDLSVFSKYGEFTQYSNTTVDQIEERAKDADVLLLSKLPINENTIASLTELKLILITATGFDNVDLNYCSNRGIDVRNAKGYSTVSVVQHTFASLFYLFEKLSYYDEYVKNGEYSKCPCFFHIGKSFEELYGMTWGIVGLGNIGRGVAQIAESFGCRVIYCSTSGKNSDGHFKRVSFDELLAESDIISIHAPLNDNTRNMFCYETFKKMKSTAFLVNVGRGPIVNDGDIVRALNENLIAGAALDVVSKEPILEDNPLLGIKDSTKLLVTPHIAWASTQARQRLIDEMVKNLDSYIDGGDYNKLA